MRMLLTAQMEVEASNKAVTDGTLREALGTVMEQLKPEAAYFTAQDGKRTALIVFDLQDESQIPSVAEPFFQVGNASLEMVPVMNAEDLEKGLAAWAASSG